MTHALGNLGKNDKVMYGYNFKKFSFLSTSSFTFRKCNHDVFNLNMCVRSRVPMTRFMVGASTPVSGITVLLYHYTLF
jgi:hypothetical protein